MWEWFSRSVLTKGKRPKTSEAQGIMGKERKAKRKGEAQGRSARAKRLSLTFIIPPYFAQGAERDVWEFG